MSLRDEIAAELAQLPVRPAGRMRKTVEIKTMRESIREWVAEEKRGDEGAIRTGFATIDDHLGKPMRQGELVVVAGRTSVGKTWLIHHLEELAVEKDPNAWILDLTMEMPAYARAERFAAHAWSVSPRAAGQRAWAAESSEIEESILRARPGLDRIVFYESSPTVEEIPHVVLAASERVGAWPTIVSVDYFGLLSGKGDLYTKASENARQLKQVAKDTRTIVLAAAQLSRAGGDGTKPVTIDMLRDSGAAEEASDRIFGIWRVDPIGDDETPSIADGTEIRMRTIKNRHGPQGATALLAYDVSLKLSEVDEYELRDAAQPF